MGIGLGNLSIAEFEKRTGFIFSEKDRKWLESHRTDNANPKFDSGEFHIFDMPLSIHMSETIKDKLLTILKKYNRKSFSKETCTISIIYETDKEKQLRKQKEKEIVEKEARDADPNSIWNIKWHMFIPVKINVNGSIKELYYGCFINTYTKGKTNIPDIIDGYAYISKDEQGIHGQFNLFNPEKDNDADTTEYNYIIGSGFYNLTGSYIGNIQNATFDEIRFNIKDAINEYKNSGGCLTNGKEIHFYR